MKLVRTSIIASLDLEVSDAVTPKMLAEHLSDIGFLQGKSFLGKLGGDWVIVVAIDFGEVKESDIKTEDQES